MSSDTVIWNPWHGCTKVSAGCQNCYMFRRDSKYGIDSTLVHKTKSFRMPVQKDRHKNYKVPAGSTIFTCFTSDFFHPDADEWRPEAWAMIRERSDCHFYMITKRPERIAAALPPDWGSGYDNVTITCTCENQYWADRRLPIFLELPIKHKEIIHEPMLGAIDIRRYLEQYGLQIEMVSVGGESGEGPGIRPLNYGRVIETKMQCVEYGVPFHFHQTGSYLIRGNKEYRIPREYQESQAHAAGIDYDPSSFSSPKRSQS